MYQMMDNISAVLAHPGHGLHVHSQSVWVPVGILVAALLCIGAYAMAFASKKGE